ncbi:preprotein translocase subunit SecD [Halapricum hydrolyticum]|uniref:Protein-export membrane protein SecD n=1 Tax=Halapricum hydrolyticum TaxID=2979991 RepID=A0AAE3LEU8_9EURY|nr:preprotein translocase subunit SecD [Halapricum hydrolyticum]MCU4717615.1 preprotein translocase subunit SecD [Halapricum hydrolyticum]MCU4726856.1 preprotein translocase subunit SecD [Halapricum hydrolyticum]
MISLRENWRIVMLVVFLLASALVLVGPVGQSDPGTQTEFVELTGDDKQLTLEQSTITLDNTTVETTNESTDTIVASDADIEVEGEVAERTNSSARVINGSLTITGGTVVTPENTTDITATERSIAIGGETTLHAENSNVTLALERRADAGLTNLQYGFDLSGGTRIRAPLAGMHATDLDFDQNQSAELNRQLAEQLGVEPIDVRVRSGTIEVFSQDVTREEFASALQASGFDATEDDINDGVTAATRENVVEILQSKIDRTGLAGGTVTTVGDGFVVVEVPNAEIDEVRDIVTDRGVVRIVAEVREPGANSTTNTTVITGDDIASTGQIGQRTSPSGEVTGWEAPVTLTEEGAQQFQQQMQELGFTSATGIGNCDRTGGPGSERQGSYCLLTTLDGELVRSNGMGEDLGTELGANENWPTEDPTFTIGASSAAQAEEIKISLEVGSLPTNLDLSEDAENDVSYIQPSLAEEFKSLSLITGLLAWFAVAGMVFLRYNKVRVAIPMIFTAIAEVFILLGFAAVSGLALDLSHIAGLIAVIGTGVDDLIIIADEILQQGEVATGRVFQNRFRKAFWVIGAAAVTTIIAMSPLTFLSVGDLFGFAIVTIVGVLIGVLITRPAYGDILRNLVLSEDQR